MRIISGFAKGRKLNTPPGNELSIRPTADRAREALFNILGKSIQNAFVLDLFAGTGALGLEAFSRGAHFVVFVDNSPLALGILKKNCLRCLKGYRGNAEVRVIQHDLRSPLLPLHLPRDTDGGFDFILADPPYGKNLSETVLILVNNSSLLKPNGLLIIEERHNILLPEILSTLHRVDLRIYGETGFHFYRQQAKTTV